MTDEELWFGTSGPKDAQIVIVGEAFGEAEAQLKRPFVGSSGVELNRMLASANIDRNSVLCTNVVAARPQNNEMWRFFDASKQPSEGGRTLRNLHPNRFLCSELGRLHHQISTHPRRLVIAAGNYSLWALSNCAGHGTNAESQGRRVPTGIMNWRGSMWYMLNDLLDETKGYSETRLLPLIHPAAIMRAWYNRDVTIHDLKARVPMALRGDWRASPSPVLWAPPNFAQAKSRLEMWLAKANAGTEIALACDIETTRKTLITCIGFCDSPNFAMSIPFVRPTAPKEFESYWTPKEEAELWYLIRRVLTHPRVKIEGQNFIYDTQYLQIWAGVTTKLDFDSMLAQNVLFPGTPKGLDYLSSLYCKYHWYWKEDGKDWDTIDDLSRHLEYNCWDVLRTREVCASQRGVIEKMRLGPQWALKMKINDLCLRMMNRGIRFDSQRSTALAVELSDALNKIHSELEYIVPQEVLGEAKTPWYRSAQQTNRLFYDVLGLKGVHNRKTGNVTGGKEALNELPKKHPEWNPLFERLRLARSVANTAGVIQSKIDRDGRMRCSFNPGGTETHRLSSSKNAFGGGLNLQNLSKGKED